MESITPSRKLRFGIGRADGEPGGSFWQLRASASEQDIYIEESSTKEFSHVSLHASGQWHTKITDRVNDTTTKAIVHRPDEQWPGLTWAFHLSAPSSWGRRSSRHITLPDVRWVYMDDDAHIFFDVFIDERDVVDDKWPGYSTMGTHLVGRVPLAKGGSVVVVCHATDEPVTVTIPRNPENEENMRRIAQIRGGDIRACFHGSNDKGAIVFRYGYGMDPDSVLATVGPDEAL
jgi:hypothetical protein